MSPVRVCVKVGTAKICCCWSICDASAGVFCFVEWITSVFLLFDLCLTFLLVRTVVAWRVIILTIALFVPLVCLLSLLSVLHFTAWGKLASQWQRTRLIFASFERKAIGNSPSMFAPLKKV
eukprot:SAG31_NODE_5968_length_2234_cov_1.716159_2_plen_121_part_00